MSFFLGKSRDRNTPLRLISQHEADLWAVACAVLAVVFVMVVTFGAGPYSLEVLVKNLMNLSAWSDPRGRKPPKHARQPVDDSSEGRLRAMVALSQGFNGEEIQPAALLREDLDFNSLDFTGFASTSRSRWA